MNRKDEKRTKEVMKNHFENKKYKNDEVMKILDDLTDSEDLVDIADKNQIKEFSKKYLHHSAKQDNYYFNTKKKTKRH